MERELKEARKAFDSNDDKIAKDAASKKAAGAAADDLDAMTDTLTAGTETAPKSKKSKGKGKRAATARRGSDATEESVSKKRKTQ